MPIALDGPKNIVLFSDGTGNSASKAFKTNVWRTYQALDLDEPILQQRRQVAFYKDGVGTETFKPFALLGSAFGVGVMRDVKALYTFLCRNYRDGDRIYAFGFSRGAFTIRLLVGLLGKCGIVRSDDENQLFHGVAAAYRAFRRDFLIRASKNRSMIYHWLLPPPFYEADGTIDLRLERKPLRPHVTFLGLWDTVDAYGMPIEELKQGIDEWIWPLSFADLYLPKIVDQACHALSLDDERPTFRPLLWDERDPADKAKLQQVWFAGVHANVGGGYPIDDLSLVPLVWMLEQAKDAGLRFFKEEVDYFASMRNVHGRAYDSRAGVAGYYRYGPRSVQKLCKNKDGDDIAVPVVHDSVIERIAARIVNYAPLSLPASTTLRNPRTGIIVTQDEDFLKAAWDTVFWRRVTYFATLALTFFLLLAPAVFSGAPVAQASHIEAAARTSIWDKIPEIATSLASKVVEVLPKWAAPWITCFEQHPIWGSILVAVFVWLFFLQSAKLQRCICERSEWAWAAMKGNQAVPRMKPTRTDDFIRKLRLSPGLNDFGKWYDQTAVPFVFGALLFFLLCVVGAIVLWTIVVELRTVWLVLAVALAFGATVVAYVNNIRFRRMLERELEAMLGGPSKLPELDPFETASKLAAFKTKAAGITMQDGSTLLESYVGPVLLPNDLYFAMSCGLFLLLVDQLLATPYPVFGYLAWFGLAYAIADMAEDVLLAKTLTEPAFRWAPWVPWLTRVKMLCMTASVAGIAVFIAMRLAAHFFKPATPSRF